MKNDPTTQALITRRKKLLGNAYRLFYDRPLHLVEGRGVWLFDQQGRRYLDCYNNVPHVGHCHPRVVEAICRQAGRLNTHTRYLHENILDHAERLGERLPPALDQTHYGCSGTEANELALRMAMAFTGNRGVIVTDHAYHGHSCSVVQFSTEDTPPDARGNHVVTIAAPDTYRGAHRGEDAAERYADLVDEAIETLAQRGHRPAALFIDTVLSSEGILTVPDGYLASAAHRVRQAGGLFVADEVQAGFGRSGGWFWGFEKLGAEPDIVTMGKPMGNGHPVSAMVTRREIVDTFSQESHYFNTFAGNPVSLAAANAVLDVMEDEGLQLHAEEMGHFLLGELRNLAGDHEAIGDVRGTGLFLGIDFVQDQATRLPDPALARRIVNSLRERGVLAGITGAGENVLKIRPPMVIEAAETELLLGALDSALREARQENP